MAAWLIAPVGLVTDNYNLDKYGLLVSKSLYCMTCDYLSPGMISEV